MKIRFYNISRYSTYFEYREHAEYNFMINWYFLVFQSYYYQFSQFKSLFLI